MIRKTVFIAFMLLFCSFQNFAQNQILGKWISEDKKGVIEVFQQKAKYYGKIVWLKPDKDIPSTDTENPDKSKRSQPLLNLVILKDFDYMDKEWKNGTVYDPANGRTYACTLKLINDKALRIRGYWGPFYRTEIWTRKE